jgi:hypothetical protein
VQSGILERLIHLITNENLQKIMRRSIINSSPPTLPRIGLCPLSPAGIFLPGFWQVAFGASVLRIVVAGVTGQSLKPSATPLAARILSDFGWLERHP